ncbi:MAG TPA: tetratricopeptide repeat protein [Candidatus Polarisedimenticolia bacterium]|nr:tetratricopeptide repeat protein [Candidatus Polarisedimenticolia bacterium]
MLRPNPPRCRILRPLALGAFLALGTGEIRDSFAITALAARNTAFKLQSEAMKLYKDGSYKRAIELLRQVTNLSLNSFLAHFYLGLALSADRQYAEALEPLKTALELEPGHIQAHIALGDVYLKLGDTTEARAEYLRALTTQDNYAPAHDGLGRVYEAQGDDDRAVDEYQKALQINAAFPDAYASLGELYLRRGRLDDAIELFLKAIQIKPDFALGYSRLGIAYSREGLVNQAIAAINHGKEIAPQDPLPYLSLGRIYLDAENLDRAESEIEAALVRDPGGHEGPILKARLLLAHQDLHGAQKVLDDALAAEIREPEGRKEVEKERQRLGAIASRTEELTSTIGRSPESAPAYVELAALLSEAGAADRAAELGARAAELRPDPPTRLSLAYYLLKARRTSEAVTVLKSLAEQGNSAALLNLGVAQASLGQDEAATASYRKYLETHPKDPAPHLYLGNSLLRLGRTGEARASYQTYLDVASGDEKTGKVRRLLRLLQPAGAAP